MSINHHMPRQVRHELKQIGWTLSWRRWHTRTDRGFESATWMHKARELPKEQFKHEVEKHLTGKDTEPYEIVSFESTRASCRWSSKRLKQRG